MTWMFRTQGKRARLLAGAHPDGYGSSDERGGIVADEGCRAVELSTMPSLAKDGCPVSVVHPQQDACRIGAVGDKLGVVRRDHELVIHAVAGVALRDDLLAADVAVDAQIAPVSRIFSPKSTSKGAYLRCGNSVRSGSPSARRCSPRHGEV